MRQGSNLCYDIEKTIPDWSAYASEGTFVPEQFFNWEYMNQEANYMAYVRENENHGFVSAGVPQATEFIRESTFSMTIRCGADTEE